MPAAAVGSDKDTPVWHLRDGKNVPYYDWTTRQAWFPIANREPSGS